MLPVRAADPPAKQRGRKNRANPRPRTLIPYLTYGHERLENTGEYGAHTTRRDSRGPRVHVPFRTINPDNVVPSDDQLKALLDKVSVPNTVWPQT